MHCDNIYCMACLNSRNGIMFAYDEEGVSKLPHSFASSLFPLFFFFLHPPLISLCFISLPLPCILGREVFFLSHIVKCFTFVPFCCTHVFYFPSLALSLPLHPLLQAPFLKCSKCGRNPRTCPIAERPPWQGPPSIAGAPLLYVPNSSSVV